MVSKKVCMLGAYAVGKTSLVARFVRSMFSEKYQTTVGVKIDKKEVQVGSETVRLMLWDLAGEDDFGKVRLSYLRGAAGFLLVVDGTRRKTLEVARELQKNVGKDLPFLVLANKQDLEHDWEIEDEDLESWRQEGATVLKTSAKSGDNVEEAFQTLASRLL